MAPSATRAITTNALIIRPAPRARCKVIVSGARCRLIVADICHSQMGGCPYSELTVSLGCDKHRVAELTVLSIENNPKRENAESPTHPHFHNGSGNGEFH